MKKIIALLLCAVLLCSYAVPALAATSLTFTLSPATTTLQRGDTVRVAVTVSSTGVVDAFGVMFKYDEDVFEISGGRNNTKNIYEYDENDEEITAVSNFSKAEGSMSVSFYIDTAPNAEIGYVTLKVKDTAPIGATTFTGTPSAKLDGATIPSSINTVNFTITCEHSWGSWGQGDANKHSRTCTKCSSTDTANHEWDAGMVTKPASCKEAGVKTYTCTVCNRTKTEAIAKTENHIYGSTWTNVDDNNHTRSCTVCGNPQTVPHRWAAHSITKPASCKEEGVKTYKCGDCKATKTEPIPKTDDHSFGAWEKISDTQHKRTCSICGTKTETANHKWDAGKVTTEPTCKTEGVKTFTCSDCKGTKTEAVPKTDDHSYGAWEKISDTQHKRTCTVCGTKTETANHKWDAGKVTTEPTCKTEGVKTFTCSECKGTKTESVPKTNDHKYGEWEKVNDTQHKHTCTVCGVATESENHKWDKGEITTVPNCKDSGIRTYTCSECKGTKTEVVPSTGDHGYGPWEKISDTEHKRVCTGCKEAFETAAHKWDAGKVTKPASCKEEGVKTFTCSDCKATKTESIARLTTHDYGTWVKLDDNNHKRTCKVCGDTVFETAAHTWNAGTVTKAASCKEEGVKTFACTACGATKTESIAKLTTHDYGAWVKLDDNNHKRTCKVCGDTVFETAAHTWNAGVVTKVATCKEEGVKTFTCTACGASYTEAVAKLTTHTYDHDCDTDCNVCGLTRTTEHKYGEKLSSDKDGHFYACTVCGNKKDAAAHVPGPAATEKNPQTCTVCGYIIKPAKGHSHKYANGLSADATGHWYTCSGCNERKDFQAHVFDNDCDVDCNTCKFTRTTEHKFGEEWSSDKDTHFHACTVCGEKKDVAEHAPGVEATETTAQTCTACGYEIVAALGHTHVFGEVWEKDDAKHWKTCACGEKGEEADHVWSDDGSICTVCLAEQVIEEEEPATTSGGNMGILAAVIAAVVVIGGIIAVVLLKKKKA